MFTPDNTKGYTQAELDILNRELAERLAAIDPADDWLRAETEKAFADEVSGRATTVELIRADLRALSSAERREIARWARKL